MDTHEYIWPSGAEHARPACFGDSQLRIPDRAENERLCSVCMGLGQLESTHWNTINNFGEVIIEHHHSFDALLESGREGCHLCGLLLIAWEEKCRLIQEPGGGWVGKEGRESYSLDGDIALRFERAREVVYDAEMDRIHVTILCGDLPRHMCGQLICKPMQTNFRAFPETCLPTSSDTNTGSSASLSRIKAWLDICTSSHPACSQANSEPPPLPTRVIAVGQKGSSKCYFMSGKEKSGHYATLSHCWGDPSHRPLSTTDQTLALRQQGIEDEELPKTFRHAVQVCREIGIEYLWIDSLCIIQEQESQEDWVREAPRMGLVYGNSRLTISATAAANSTEGCFKERLGQMFWPCPIVLFGQARYVSRYPTFDETVCGDPGDIVRGLGNPLGHRAWVLQEQVLSRRSIVFSKTRLIWRCPTLSTSEKYPLGIPHNPKLSLDNCRILHCVINGITSIMSKESEVDMYVCWYNMVEDFTARSLTYDEDTLPAIAGIAKRFGEVADDSYHAGLWRHDMSRGLLWRPDNSPSTADKTKSARAPSWSWASVNCGVAYSRFSMFGSSTSLLPFSPLVDDLDVSDPATGKDHPFGVTSKASLRLSGVLVTIINDMHEDSGSAPAENGTLLAHDFQHSWDDRRSGRPDQTPLFGLPVGVLHGRYYEPREGDRELCKASWKRSLETGIDEFERHNEVWCLVLQAIEGKQDTYSRVGIGVLSGYKTTKISRLAFAERMSLTIV